MTPRKRGLIGGGFLLLLILAGAGWLGLRYLETKARACECEDPIDEQRFALWNPLRDRAPEREGERVLLAMRSGDCKAMPVSSEDCAIDRNFVMNKWKLTGKYTHPGSIILRYLVTRTGGGHGTFGGPVWVTVEQRSASWTATNVGLYY